jgi:PmbA protein
MERLMEIARKVGDQVEVYSRTTAADDVSFENGKLKDIDSKLQSGVALRIIKGDKMGTAYTRNLTDREGLVQNALASLKGNIEVSFRFPLTRETRRLSTFDPAIGSLTNSALVDECARACETLVARTRTQVNVSASKITERIRIINSLGTDISTELSWYFSTAMAIYPGSYASIMRTQVAKRFTPLADQQLDYIARTYSAGARVVKLPAGRMKVLFLPEAIYALVWRLKEGTNGKNVYEQVSPLRTKLGEPAFSEKLTVIDETLDDTRPGARAFDDEASPTSNLTIVEKGILRSFYCDLHYAARLGAAPTGHGYKTDVTTKPAPELEHLVIRPGQRSFPDLLKLMDRGVIVAGVMGAHSGNILNGDYSIGLSPGLVVEHGEIVGQVKDSMVAGNVYETLKNVIDIEDRVHFGGMGMFPAVLCDDVSVATQG